MYPSPTIKEAVEISKMVNRQEAHNRCVNNRKEIKKYGKASCFGCCTHLSADEIVAWVDDDNTALCPKCGIDSVLPGKMSMVLLKEMQEAWF